MTKFELIDPLFLPHCGCEIQVTVNTGEVLVLVGENGIGKSTLLHRFYEMIQPEVTVMVEQKSSDYFYDRKLIFLKQFFLAQKFPNFDQKLFLKLWIDFRLHEKEDRMLYHLSGGESQALKLTLALAKAVDFYFLDEPSQSLDSERKIILRQSLNDLKNQAKKIILVEHNQEWLAKGWRVQSLQMENTTLKRGAEWTI